MHESLASKNSQCFWKTWKNKIGKSTKRSVIIEGNLSSSEAAGEFAEFFRQTTSPNSMQFDNDKRKEYSNKIINYTGDILTHQFDFSAELTALALIKMEKGKSPGFDMLTVEHLNYSHPVVFSLLSNLFNAMLRNSYVPTDFGKGITIPIPKNDNLKGAQSIDSFRGITLSPVISKLFEHCILILCSDYFATSINQFGFKPKMGCHHAVYTVRKVVDYYIQNNSTMNLCLLDMAKGFDKVNHSMLLLKLMKRNVPVALVKLLQYWYSNSSNRVRWENLFSQPYKFLVGIRQGGVLSPVLFSVYVNDFLKSFRRFGCQFKGFSVSALMYADDLVLLSPSVTELQIMIEVCCRELALLDIKINSKKSNAIRIGNRCKVKCADLRADQEIIHWVNEAKYLGVYIQSSPKFKCNFDKTKVKYYRAANAILAKLGNKDNTAVTLKLLASTALPVLTYSIESLALNKSELISLNHPWDRSFQKVFHTFDIQITRHCQRYNGYLPISHYYCLRSMSFLRGLSLSPNLLLRDMYENSGREDICRLAGIFNCESESFLLRYKEIIYADFLDKLVQ